MDPFGRWSQQRLIEEVATTESRGYGPAKRGRPSTGVAALVLVILVLATVFAMSSRDGDAPSPTAEPTAPLTTSR